MPTCAFRREWLAVPCRLHMSDLVCQSHPPVPLRFPLKTRPEFTKKNPPGSAKALTSSLSMTLMVNGTFGVGIPHQF